LQLRSRTYTGSPFAGTPPQKEGLAQEGIVQTLPLSFIYLLLPLKEPVGRVLPLTEWTPDE
jgi:hypothetical protein